MSTFAAPKPAVRAALAGLIDYAGLFPPAQLDMAGAAGEYAAARLGAFSWMLGRFIVPSARIVELAKSIAHGEPPFALSVITGTDLPAHLPEEPELRERVTPEAFEVPAACEEIGRVAAARKTHADLPAYVELPRDAGWRAHLPGAMGELAENGLGAKVRCGGLQQSAFPSPEELASFVFCAAQAGVRFKATAGLHHPIRHLEPKSGLHMHGFLNLLFAAVFAAQGASEAEIGECLASEDAREFVFEADGLQRGDRRASTPEIERARSVLFAGYGSCSFNEPVEDLQKLGLL